MRKLSFLILFLLLTTACSLVGQSDPFEPLPQPSQAQPPLMTVIVELPIQTPTLPVIQRVKPIIGSSKSDSFNFIQIIKIQMMAGDTQGIAEKVKYPINVMVNTRVVTINSAKDFEKNFKAIFSENVQKTLLDSNEDDLLLTSKGISIGDGAIWINQYCSDSACTKGEYLITQINH
jgi:hypothetical protein